MEPFVDSGPAWWMALERENLERLEELLFMCISEVRIDSSSLTVIFAVGNYSIFPMVLGELQGEVSIDGYIEKIRDCPYQPLERQSIRLLTRRYPLPSLPRTAKASGVEVRFVGRFEGPRWVEKEFELGCRFPLSS